MASRSGYHAFEERLRAARFAHDQESGVICRFKHRDADLVLDAMPADPAILGFANRWQGPAVDASVSRSLPTGATIRAAPPPFMLAMKLEAFKGRGDGDFLESRDFADIVALVDGREELVDEVVAAPEELRNYVAAEITRLTEDSYFESGIAGALPGDVASQRRVAVIVMPRLSAIIAAAT